MMQQYKIHIWNHIEYANDEIMRTCEIVFLHIIRLQQPFLNEMPLTIEAAILNYDFGLLSVCRDGRNLNFFTIGSHVFASGSSVEETKRPQ